MVRHAASGNSSGEATTTAGYGVMSTLESMRRDSSWRLTALACAVLLPGLGMAGPPLPNEPISTGTQPSPPGRHWVWVKDIAFSNMPDGRATLVDGDTGAMLGMLSTGYGFNGVVVPRTGDIIYSLARHSRSPYGCRDAL